MDDGKADPEQPTVQGNERHDAGQAPPAQPLPPGAVWLGTPARDHAGLAAIGDEVYELGPEIGGGGMGRVLIARDRRLGRVLAVKVMRDASGEHLARFVNEARITSRLQHPAIVNIHEVGRLPGGEPFYAMKRVVGRPLSAVILETRTLDERLALLPRVLTIAEALAYAHTEGVVHRDLKPSNVMVGNFGETVVLDWGLAKEVGAVEIHPGDFPSSPGLWASETVLGSVLGTPGFMPPEQAAGDPVGKRADVYAIGAILYTVLAGEPPYRGGASDDVLAAVKAGPPPPLGARVAGLPPDLLAIVDKAMARDAGDRYPSAVELAADLRLFEAGQLVAVHRYSTWQLVRRWLARHRAAVLVAAVGLGALVLTGALAVGGVLRERDHARAAQANADTQREAAEELVDFMIFTVRERLGNVGRLDVLDGVAERILGYYRRVAEHGGLDLRQEWRRAHALMFLGDSERERGAFESARRAFDEARAIEERRLLARPGDVRVLRDVSMATSRLAYVEMLQGALEASAEHYRRDLEVTEIVAASDPGNETYQDELATSWQTLGSVEVARRRHASAAEAYGRAKVILEGMVARQPTVPRWQVALASLHEALGDLASEREELDDAVASYQRALDLLGPVVARHPAEVAWRRQQSVVWSDLGDAERRRGHTDAALAAFRKDLEVSTALAALDPENETYQRDLMISRVSVGDVLLARGAAAEARPIYDEALASARGRLARMPDNTLWRGDVAEILAKVAEADLARGRSAPALAPLQESVDMLRALAGEATGDVQRQLDLAEGWLRLAEARAKAGDPPGARAAAVEAKRVCDGLVPSADPALAALAERARALLATP